MDLRDETIQPAHVELILQHIDALPTLSPIATRVLELSGSSDAEISEIVELVESDPTLAARLLAMCRRADKGLAVAVTTVERAVMLLGLDAVRAALLSVQVFELLDSPAAEPAPVDPGALDGGRLSGPPVDRRSIWLFSLAVACAAEALAQRMAPKGPNPSEVFLCGLLHDLGKIALDRVMPRSFAAIAQTTERRRADFAEVSRRVIGIDHRTVGKRLGEHWGLPHTIQDAMWLTAQDPAHLPNVPHRRTLQLVIGGVGLARALHLGWSGDFRTPPDLGEVFERCEIEPFDFEPFAEHLHRRVMDRAAALGLMSESDPSLLLRAIGQANRELGRLSALLDTRARGTEAHTGILVDITAFLEEASLATSLPATMALVARSASKNLDAPVPAIIWQHRDGAACEVYQFDGRFDLLNVDTERSLPDARPLRELIFGGGIGPMAWLSTVASGLVRPMPAESLHHVTLDPGTGACAVLLMRSPGKTLDRPTLDALRAAWTSAIGAAAQHHGARRLGEQLAEANRALLEAQTVLVETRADRRLAQVSAGAAHEMNNALTLISGQAQGLMRSGSDPGLVAPAAKSIVRASERLSELISALHFFAKPPKPQAHLASPEKLVRDAVDQAVRRRREESIRSHDVRSDSTIIPIFEGGLPEVRVDSAQMCDAVTELVLNAIQSQPKGRVEVRVHADPGDDRLIISVADDGVGMNEETLAHAFDPFFSSRPAGRRTGLGLARARRLVELNGGVIEIVSTPGEGTTARIVLSIHARAGASTRAA